MHAIVRYEIPFRSIGPKGVTALFAGSPYASTNQPVPTSVPEPTHDAVSRNVLVPPKVKAR
jgi:hypothetical protein